MSRKDGPAAGILEAAEGAITESARAAGQQLELIPPGLDPARASHKAAVDGIKRDQAGRPPGAQNKTTRQIKELVRKTFGDPVFERFRWAAHTPESLAAVLGCTKLEAFDRLDKIRSELARLFYGQMAPVDGDGNAVVPFFQMMMGGTHQHNGAPLPPWIEPDESEEKQTLSLPSPAVSHDGVSHEDDK